jgi:hypothetical protein
VKAGKLPDDAESVSQIEITVKFAADAYLTARKQELDYSTLDYSTMVGYEIFLKKRPEPPLNNGKTPARKHSIK